MGKPKGHMPSTSQPPTGRKSTKYDNETKLAAILMVRRHDNNKATVARFLDVPSSTLRDWCKNEDKIRSLMAPQKKQTINGDASHSSLDSTSSNPAEPSSLKSPSSVEPPAPSTSQLFNSTPSKPPGLYRPWELNNLKNPETSPKTPAALPPKSEIPGSSKRNKTELHRIGTCVDLIYGQYNSQRLLQVPEVSSTSQEPCQAHGATDCATALPSIDDFLFVLEFMTQTISQMQQLQLQYQQIYQELISQRIALIRLQEFQETNEGRFPTISVLPSRPKSPGSLGRNKTTSFSSPAPNPVFSPGMLQVSSFQHISPQGPPLPKLSAPIPGAGPAATKAQELFQNRLLATDRVQPGHDNAHPVLPLNPSVPLQQFSYDYRTNHFMSNNGQFMPEQNVFLDSPPQDSRKFKPSPSAMSEASFLNQGKLGIHFMAEDQFDFCYNGGPE